MGHESDLSSDGYCVIEGALSTERAATLRDRLLELVDEDDRTETGWRSGTNRRVYDLINRDPAFLELATNPRVLSIVGSALSEDCLLSSITGHIVAPGGVAQDLHCDQEYIWRPWPHAYVVNVVWMLDEFRPFNGATRVVRGSHQVPSSDSRESSLLVGPAGTACVIDGRLVHGGGANTSASPRCAVLALYCAPFIRQQENAPRSLAPEIEGQLTPEARRLLGFDVWNGLGMMRGLPPSWMTRSSRTGPLAPDWRESLGG